MSRSRVLGLVALLAAVLLAATQLVGWHADPPDESDPAEPGASGTTVPGSGVSEVLPGAVRTPGSESPVGENLAGDAQSVGSDELLPGLAAAPRPARGALVSRPLPRSASSRGRLVAGYPGEVLPAAPSSKVRSSSVSSSGRALQVALVATTSREVDAVALFYRQSLTRLGFQETGVAAATGATGLGFRRGSDHVVVTVTATGPPGSTYSVYGTLHVGHG